MHLFAAYWGVVLVSIHLGLRWQRVMHAVRHALRFKAESKARTVALRLAAAGIAAYGWQSSFVMEVGTKLTLQMSLEWWDFAQSTLGFFLRWLSIVGLYTAATYYFSRLDAHPRLISNASNAIPIHQSSHSIAASLDFPPWTQNTPQTTSAQCSPSSSPAT